MKKLSLSLLLIGLLSMNQSLFAQTKLNSNDDEQSGDIQELAPIKDRAFKFEFFSPFYGTLNFDYEQVLSNKINIDGGFGIIGVGVNELVANNSGLFVRGGVRLYFSPDYYTDDTRRYSDFQGAYFRPEVALSFFKFENGLDALGNTVSGNNSSMGILLNFGKQKSLANVVTLDGWIGIGYNIEFSDESGDMPFKFAYLGGSGNFPLAFSFGFSVGVLTK